MQFKVIINKKTGDSVTEVIDREDHLCSQSYKVATLVGEITKDEEIGPEGDEVHEIVS